MHDRELGVAIRFIQAYAPCIHTVLRPLGPFVYRCVGCGDVITEAELQQQHHQALKAMLYWPPRTYVTKV